MQAIKKDIDKNREKKDVVILILGNKSDRADARKVDSTQVNEMVFVCINEVGGGGGFK